MKKLRKLSVSLFITGLIVLFSDITIAQEKETKSESKSEDTKTAFVDRDGDGIHDGMEHRFRRGKKHRNKRHGIRNRASRNRNQGGSHQNQSPNGP